MGLDQVSGLLAADTSHSRLLLSFDSNCPRVQKTKVLFRCVRFSLIGVGGHWKSLADIVVDREGFAIFLRVHLKIWKKCVCEGAHILRGPVFQGVGGLLAKNIRRIVFSQGAGVPPYFLVNLEPSANGKTPLIGLFACYRSTRPRFMGGSGLVRFLESIKRLKFVRPPPLGARSPIRFQHLLFCQVWSWSKMVGIFFNLVTVGRFSDFIL